MSDTMVKEVAGPSAATEPPAPDRPLAATSSEEDYSRARAWLCPPWGEMACVGGGSRSDTFCRPARSLDLAPARISGCYAHRGSARPTRSRRCDADRRGRWPPSIRTLVFDRRRGSSFGGPKRPANWKVAALYLEVSGLGKIARRRLCPGLEYARCPEGAVSAAGRFAVPLGSAHDRRRVCRPRRFAIPQRDRTRERSAKLVQSVYTTALAHWSTRERVCGFR